MRLSGEAKIMVQKIVEDTIIEVKVLLASVGSLPRRRRGCEVCLYTYNSQRVIRV